MTMTTKAVLVHRYKVYDVTKDDYLVSTRMATPEKIEKIGGEIIPGTGLEVSEDLVKNGWTEKNFTPN